MAKATGTRQVLNRWSGAAIRRAWRSRPGRRSNARRVPASLPPSPDQERKEWEEALVQQVLENQALRQISVTLASSLDLSRTLNQIAEVAAQIIPAAQQAIIHLLDGDSTQLKPAAYFGNLPANSPQSLEFTTGRGVVGLVATTAETINIPDAPQDPRFLIDENNSRHIRSLLVAPIRVAGNNLGTLSVSSRLPGVFNSYDERLLTVLGAQAAIAIERARTLQFERDQRQVAEVLSEISTLINATHDFETVLDRLLEQVQRLVPYDSACMLLVEKGYTRTARMRGYEDFGPDWADKTREITLNVQATAHLQQMVEQLTPVVIADTRTCPSWQRVEGSYHILSWAGAPLVLDGEVIAILSLDKTEAGFYNQDHLRRLMAVANHSTLALQNARLFETVQRRLTEVNALYQIGKAITQASDLDVMMESVAGLLREHFGFDLVLIFTAEPTARCLTLKYGSSPASLELAAEGLTLAYGEGIPGHVADSLRPFATQEALRLPFYHPLRGLPAAQAELAVPLRQGDALLGVLDIYHRAGQSFGEHDVQIVSTIGDQLAVALTKLMLYANLQTTLAHEQAARAQLVQAEKLAALGRIVASVAHELNNPLQAIQNALYLVKLQEQLSPQAEEDMQVALNEASRMAELIGRLRETYRPATAAEFHPESLNDLVEEVHKLIRTHLRHNSIRFSFDPDPNLPAVAMLRDQIKQVILNVCLNAVESMPEGGRLMVNTRPCARYSGVRLTITDTGAGIPADILPNIFDPFVTTKEGGTGLGLAITYDLVRRHNGTIEVNSAVGQGTSFIIRLPEQAGQEIGPLPDEGQAGEG